MSYYADDTVTLHHGDCLKVMAELPDASVDSVVTDPPYGLGFMGREWDNLPPGEPWARECLRVLKPGGHLLAFGGTRTWHRLAVAVEDAGFEIRDSIAWLYGSGFPKSLDVGKAIDRAAGIVRTERSGVKPGHENFIGRDNIASLREGGALSGEGGYSRPWMHDPEKVEASHYTYAPVTHDAERWNGWGTALKPAFEPIIVARKPLIGTAVANVVAHGTGALNIDGCRVCMSASDAAAINAKHAGMDATTYERPPGTSLNLSTNPMPLKPAEAHAAGRWPTNVVLSDDQAAELDRQSGVLTSGGGIKVAAGSTNGFMEDRTSQRSDAGRVHEANAGGASRFFPTFRYQAKAPAAERPKVNGEAHATVKPLDLMRWLVRLVTPPGGTVLEPFAGSGTTAEACVHEHMQCIAIEREAAYLPLIVARLSKPMQVGFDFGGVA